MSFFVKGSYTKTWGHHAPCRQSLLVVVQVFEVKRFLQRPVIAMIRPFECTIWSSLVVQYFHLNEAVDNSLLKISTLRHEIIVISKRLNYERHCPTSWFRRWPRMIIVRRWWTSWYITSFSFHVFNDEKAGEMFDSAIFVWGWKLIYFGHQPHIIFFVVVV